MMATLIVVDSYMGVYYSFALFHTTDMTVVHDTDHNPLVEFV